MCQAVGSMHSLCWHESQHTVFTLLSWSLQSSGGHAHKSNAPLGGVKRQLSSVDPAREVVEGFLEEGKSEVRAEGSTGFT